MLKRDRPILWALSLLAILALAAVWRLPATQREWRFLWCENDSLYQLHRVQKCLEHYPRVESVDYDSHYPRGYRIHWINLHTLFYATVAKVAGIGPEQLDRLTAVVSWLPPLFGLVAVLLAVAVAQCFIASDLCALAVGLLCAFSADVVRPFFFGTIDHHLFAHLGVLLLVLGRLRLRLWWWVLGLVSLIAMTPEAIIYVSVLLGCVFLAELAALLLRDDAQVSPWSWYLSPAAVSVLTWASDRTLATSPLPVLALSWIELSLFQCLWLAVVGIGMRGVLSAAAAAPRQGRALPRRSVVALGALGLFGAACLLLLRWTGVFDSLTERLLLAHRFFVGEEASVFRGGFWRAAPWYRILAFSGVFFAAKLAQSYRTRADSDDWFRWIALSVVLVLGLKEYRHLYVLSSLQLVGLGVALFGTERFLRRLPMFAGRVAQAVPGIVLTLAVASPFVRSDVLDRAAIHGNACGGLPLLQEVSGWLKLHTPAARQPGQERASYGIFTPWSIGHHIHVFAQRPVVVDPFNLEVDSKEEDTVQAAWLARQPDGLMAALRKNQARYLVLMNPAEEIVGELIRNQVPKDRFVSFSGGEPTFSPAMSQFASFRLFMTGGLSGEFGQLQPRFYSDESETYTVAEQGSGPRRVIIPRAQVYEVKPGAVITGIAPNGEREVTVSFTLRRSRKRDAAIEVPVAVGEDGRFRISTALPAPEEETTFRVDSGYRIKAGNHVAEVTVTQDAVDHGSVIEVQWADHTARVEEERHERAAGESPVG